MNNQIKQQIDLKATQPFLTEDGNQLLSSAIIFRKISKFLAGTKEDGLVPIEVFYDLKTGKVVLELLPVELREEFKKYNQDINKISIPKTTPQDRGIINP